MDVREKLIDANDLLNAIRDDHNINGTNFARIRRHIESATTVDAVEVVRCKDCKYHEDEEIGMVYCPNALGGWVGENWFCADGERKEGVE